MQNWSRLEIPRASVLHGNGLFHSASLVLASEPNPLPAS